MCQGCIDVTNRYYPHLSDEEKCELLWSATCFPFGGPEHLEPQLKRLRKRTDGTVRGAQAFADRSMSQQHEYAKRRYPELGQ